MILIFCNYAATTESYTLSLHDALPISNAATTVGVPAPGVSANIRASWLPVAPTVWVVQYTVPSGPISCSPIQDRKSTRLTSSHANISYAVFCLKKNMTEDILTLPASYT